MYLIGKPDLFHWLQDLNKVAEMLFPYRWVALHFSGKWNIFTRYHLDHTVIYDDKYRMIWNKLAFSWFLEIIAKMYFISYTGFLLPDILGYV